MQLDELASYLPEAAQEIYSLTAEQQGRLLASGQVTDAFESASHANTRMLFHQGIRNYVQGLAGVGHFQRSDGSLNQGHFVGIEMARAGQGTQAVEYHYLTKQGWRDAKKDERRSVDQLVPVGRATTERHIEGEALQLRTHMAALRNAVEKKLTSFSSEEQPATSQAAPYAAMRGPGSSDEATGSSQQHKHHSSTSGSKRHHRR